MTVIGNHCHQSCNRCAEIFDPAGFWNQTARLLGTDKDYDIFVHHSSVQARESCFFLAANYVLQNQDETAVYILMYSAMLDEAYWRGPNHIVAFYKKPHSYTPLLGAYFYGLQDVIHNTTTREDMVDFIRTRVKKFRSGGKRVSNMLNGLDLHDCNPQIHSLPMDGISYSSEECKVEIAKSRDISATLYKWILLSQIWMMGRKRPCHCTRI